MRPTSDCPGPAELERFVLGTISGPAFVRVAAHVERCASCERALDELDQLSVPLQTQIRHSAEGDDLGTLPLPSPLLDAVRSASPRRLGTCWPREGRPRRIGKFELLEEVGVGSFGHVFRARDSELGRIVAIKIPRAGVVAFSEDVDRFLREARSAAHLTHPGIVSLHEVGQADDGTYFLVEEFVQGATLAQRLAEGPLSLRRAAELLAAVADALDYAHRRGVIHRDLKPSNIVLDGEGQPHLMDFGLAKREADEVSLTEDGQVLGTPAYMSPEQARGESRGVDARSDVYSLGVILYELLTGERPFRGNRRMLIRQVLEDEPRPPRWLNDKVPRDLETICLKAMAKNPARRYAGAQELADDLRRHLAGEPIRARPIGVAERLWHWCRRNPVAVSLLAAVSLGSAIGLWHLSVLSQRLVRSTALEGAAQQSEMLDIVNALYSTEIVERVQSRGTKVTHDYVLHEGAIPLPATLTIELGRLISRKSASGMEVRLYSDHPFRSRKDSGVRDAFEREALQALRARPDKPVARFEDYRGRPSLRYVTARLMEESCVKCHNSHPESTKTNWKVGEVGGALEFIRPLGRDAERTRAGLRGTFVLMAAVSGSLLGASGLVFVLSELARRRARLEREPGTGNGKGA